MPHGHQLVNQAMLVDAVSIASLNARTALLLRSFSAINTSFLMKRIRYLLHVTSLTVGDDGPMLILTAKGNANAAEVAAAMVEFNGSGPSDVTESLTQDEAWVVYQNTVVPMIVTGTGAHGQTPHAWINFGGKNGIPAIEDSGWSVHVFNAGSGQNASGTISGIVQVQGVWLRD